MAEQVFQWLSLQSRLLVVTAVVGILVMIWIATAVYNVRRGWSLVRMLQASTRGQVLVEQAPGINGFFILLSPPPEPFRRITISFHTGANPLIWPWRLVVGKPPRLVIQASLNERLQSELIWTRGQIPSKALTRRGTLSLWVQRRLDFLNYEYATRGPNPSGLIHHFTDLQTRFGSLLSKVAVQGDTVPELEISLRTAGLNADDLPPLITTIRSLGRAALL